MYIKNAFALLSVLAGVGLTPAVASGAIVTSQYSLYVIGGFDGTSLGTVTQLHIPRDICHLLPVNRLALSLQTSG